jgi:hypothetical protein
LEEKILLYIEPADREAVVEWLATWMTVAIQGPRLYSLTLPAGSGYLYFDERIRIATIQVECAEPTSEPALLAHVFWLLSLCEEAIERGIALAVIVGAKDDIDFANAPEQARYAAASYPESLLGEARDGFLKIGQFRVSLYASDHLTAFMTPTASADDADRIVATTMNEFLERQRKDRARRSTRITEIAAEAMRRLRADET